MRHRHISVVVIMLAMVVLPSCVGADTDDGVVVTVRSSECFEGVPAEGVRVFAQAPDGTLHEAFTDAAGEVRFPELTNGAAAVTVVDPSGTLRSVVGVEDERNLSIGINPLRETVTVSGTAAGMASTTNHIFVMTSASLSCAYGGWWNGQGPAFSLEVPIGVATEVTAIESTSGNTASGQGYTSEIHRVFRGALEPVTEDATFDFTFFETGFERSGTGRFRLDALGVDTPLVGPGGSPVMYIWDEQSGVLAGDMTSVDVSADGMAYDYAFEYGYPGFDVSLDRPMTQYTVMGADASATVLERGFPKAGEHTPTFLPLPKLAGADATAATLGDGLIVEAYPPDARMFLDFSVPFAGMGWSIEYRDHVTTLALPHLPEDMSELQAALEDAEPFGASLTVQRVDDPASGWISASSTAPILVSYE